MTKQRFSHGANFQALETRFFQNNDICIIRYPWSCRLADCSFKWRTLTGTLSRMARQNYFSALNEQKLHTDQDIAAQNDSQQLDDSFGKTKLCWRPWENYVFITGKQCLIMPWEWHEWSEIMRKRWMNDVNTWPFRAFTGQTLLVNSNFQVLWQILDQRSGYSNTFRFSVLNHAAVASAVCLGSSSF